MGGEKSSACDGCVVGGRASGGHADGGCASGGRASGGVCESASRCDGWVHDVRHMERERNRATLGRFVRSNLRVQVEEVHLTVAEVEEARALRGLLLMVRLESVAVAFLATTVAAIVAVAHAATRVTLSLGASRTDIVAVAAPERAHDAPRQARVTRASRARRVASSLVVVAARRAREGDPKLRAAWVSTDTSSSRVRARASRVTRASRARASRVTHASRVCHARDTKTTKTDR